MRLNIKLDLLKLSSSLSGSQSSCLKSNSLLSPISHLGLLEPRAFAAWIRDRRSLLTQYKVHMSHTALSAWSKRWNKAYALREASYAYIFFSSAIRCDTLFLQMPSMCSVKLKWLFNFAPSSFCEVICSISLPLHVNLMYVSGAFFSSHLPVTFERKTPLALLNPLKLNIF